MYSILPFLLDNDCKDAEQNESNENQRNYDNNHNRVVSVTGTIALCNADNVNELHYLITDKYSTPSLKHSLYTFHTCRNHVRNKSTEIELSEVVTQNILFLKIYK